MSKPHKHEFGKWVYHYTAKQFARKCKCGHYQWRDVVWAERILNEPNGASNADRSGPMLSTNDQPALFEVLKVLVNRCRRGEFE